MNRCARLGPLLVLAAFLTPVRPHAQGEPTATVYNGSGVNPIQFSNQYGPYLGEPWQSVVMIPPACFDCGYGAPSFPPNVLFVGLGGPARPGWTPGGIFAGEMLCRPTLALLSVSGGDDAYPPHSVAIPDNPSLFGARFCAQAAILVHDSAGRLSLELQNALLLEVGVHAVH